MLIVFLYFDFPLRELPDLVPEFLERLWRYEELRHVLRGRRRSRQRLSWPKNDTTRHFWGDPWIRNSKEKSVKKRLYGCFFHPCQLAAFGRTCTGPETAY